MENPRLQQSEVVPSFRRHRRKPLSLRRKSYGRVLYNRFRYYDPSIGRYISADPIGQYGGSNLYVYARNNPTNLTDSLGLDVNIVISRNGTTPTSVSSTVNVSSDQTSQTFSGHAIEDPSPPNPNLPVTPGEYSAASTDSLPDRTPGRVELNDVPGASRIQLHVGNTANNVEGCFAVGTTAGDGRVNDSASAMNAINSIIAADGTGNITVTITGPSNQSTNQSRVPANSSQGP